MKPSGWSEKSLPEPARQPAPSPCEGAAAAGNAPRWQLSPGTESSRTG